MLYKSRNLKKARSYLTDHIAEIVIPLFLFSFVFLAYLHNLSPSVYGGDVGDFLTAIIVRGVPHPSGYPLFTLLGIAFNSLPIGQSVAWRVGLISVISASLTVVLMYLIVRELVGNIVLGIITAATLAFFYPFWLYAEVAEVFALAYFFFILLFYLAVIYLKYKKVYILYVLSFFVGLSLSNHEVIILVFPAIALLVLWKNLKIIQLKILIRCIIFLLLGLLPYIYIPIAASHNPPFNWLGDVNLGNFYRMVTRQAYGWTSKVEMGSRLLPFDAYRKYFLIELPLILLSIVPLGAMYMLKKKKIILFIAIFFEFLITGPLFTVYGGSPIVNNFIYGVFERFYPISFLFMVMFLPFAIELVVNMIIMLLKKMNPVFAKKSYYKNIFICVFIFIPIFLFFHNMSRTDLHNIWFGDYFAGDILNSLPKKSFIFFGGDTPLFNSLYIQNAYGYRKDVNKNVNIVSPSGINSFIDKNLLLRNRKKEILKSNGKIGEQNANLLTVFSFPDDFYIFTNTKQLISPDLSIQFLFMPYGLIFKIAGNADRKLSEKQFIELQNKIWSSFRLNEKELGDSGASFGFHMLSIREEYAKAAINAGDYLTFYYGDIESAKKWYEKALIFYPMEDAYKGLGYYYYKKNDCRTSEDYIDKILSVDPKNRLAYKQLYLLYKDCYKNNKRAQEIKKTIKKMFNADV